MPPNGSTLSCYHFLFYVPLNIGHRGFYPSVLKGADEIKPGRYGLPMPSPVDLLIGLFIFSHYPCRYLVFPKSAGHKKYQLPPAVSESMSMTGLETMCAEYESAKGTNSLKNDSSAFFPLCIAGNAFWVFFFIQFPHVGPVNG